MQVQGQPGNRDCDGRDCNTMRKNQKGFTLVELIIAVAILAIVTLSICGFIVVSSRSYTSANTDIMLQQEAQLALNQMSDVIIDTTDSLNYGDGTQNVLKDSEFGAEPSQKILVVANKKDSNNDNPSYWFCWDKDDQVIYFNTSDDVINDSNPKPTFDDTKKAVLAQHVKEFRLDISQFEENRVVMISMIFENGDRQYTTSNNVTVRNRIALNKIDVEPMKKATDFTINTVTSVTLEPGDVFTMPAPVVEGTDTNKAVKWSLAGAAKNGTSITESGTLTIGKEELRRSFLVEVTRAEFQDDRSTKEVRVNIKRALHVNLSCSASTVKANDTVTINGGAVGTMLGNSCSGCVTDDPDRDWDLTNWKIVSGPAVIESSDAESAKIKVGANAQGGDKIIIEAASALSAMKNGGYGPSEAPSTPPVKKQFELTVTKGTTGDFPSKTGMKFGTDNDDTDGGLMIYDYMRDGLPTENGNYVFCVRVREFGSNSSDNDQVVLYHSTGANMRFAPDLFGLELNRSYQIFFQVLYPVPEEWYVQGNYTADSDDNIRAEYLANVNADGKYVGEKYRAGALYYATLDPPAVKLVYEGVTYPNSSGDLAVHYPFITREQRVMNKVYISTALNIKYQDLLNRIKFTIYKGEGDDISKWTRVCGYNPETMAYDKNTFAGGSITMNANGDPTGDPFMQRDINNYNMDEACGTYHIVVGYEYANKTELRDKYKYIYRSPNIRDDYAVHYYEQPQCKMTLKVDSGFNMRLPDEGNEERWTLFPVPSDQKFPFDRKSEEEQEINHSFVKYSPKGDWKGTMDNVTVTCEYSDKRDVYTVTLSSMEINGRQITTHVYGKYECRSDQDVWERIMLPYDKTETIETNLIFKKDGKTYETYFPTPSDSDFPFRADNAGEQIKENWNLVAFHKDDSGDRLLERCTVKGSYAGDTYTISLGREEKLGEHKKRVYNYGTFKWSASGRTWEEIVAGTTKDEAVWRATVTYDSIKIELPLPSEPDFPSFTDSYEQRLQGAHGYDINDTYGEGGKKWVDVKICYEYSGGMYTVTLRNPYYEPQVYSRWQCAAEGTKWTQISN